MRAGTKFYLLLQELLLKLLEDHYPLPPDPDERGPPQNGKRPAGKPPVAPHAKRKKAAEPPAAAAQPSGRPMRRAKQGPGVHFTEEPGNTCNGMDNEDHALNGHSGGQPPSTSSPFSPPSLAVS